MKKYLNLLLMGILVASVAVGCAPKEEGDTTGEAPAATADDHSSDDGHGHDDWGTGTGDDHGHDGDDHGHDGDDHGHDGDDHGHDGDGA